MRKKPNLVDARFQIEPEELDYWIKNNDIERIIQDFESESREILRKTGFSCAISDILYLTRYRGPNEPYQLSTENKTAYAAHILIGASAYRDAVTTKDAKRAGEEMFKLCINAARMNILETAEARIRGAVKGGRHPKEKIGIQIAHEILLSESPRATAKTLWAHFKKNHAGDDNGFYVRATGSEVFYDPNSQRLVEKNLFNRTVTQSITFKTFQGYHTKIKKSFTKSE